MSNRPTSEILFAMLTEVKKRLGVDPHSVANPHYYKKNTGVEVIDYIEEMHGTEFSYTTAIKYLGRAGSKENEQKDLCKAIWYLARTVEFYEITDQKLTDKLLNEREIALIVKAVKAWSLPEKLAEALISIEQQRYDTAIICIIEYLCPDMITVNSNMVRE